MAKCYSILSRHWGTCKSKTSTCFHCFEPLVLCGILWVCGLASFCYKQQIIEIPCLLNMGTLFRTLVLNSYNVEVSFQLSCVICFTFCLNHSFQIQPSLFSHDIMMMKDTLIIMSIMKDMTDVWMSGFKEKGWF